MRENIHDPTQESDGVELKAVKLKSSVEETNNSHCWIQTVSKKSPN